MRLVHWISFVLALVVALVIVAVFAVQPAAQVSLPGLGMVPLFSLLISLAVLAYLAGWVYFLGYAWALSRERRAWRRERQKLEAELEECRAGRVEEVPRIPDRPPVEGVEQS
ncbi:hypothetical protein [Oceanithermus sp.]